MALLSGQQPRQAVYVVLVLRQLQEYLKLKEHCQSSNELFLFSEGPAKWLSGYMSRIAAKVHLVISHVICCFAQLVLN
jgi:hypothetical protein